MNPLNEVFLDAAYAIALSAPGDLFHARAEALADQMERDGTRIITTRAVLLEIGNALGKPRYRADAIAGSVSCFGRLNRFLQLMAVAWRLPDLHDR